jgi:hypothetical protein
MGGANQCPLASDFVEPTKQELAETSSPLDLSDYRFDNLLSKPVATSVATAFDLSCHCHHSGLFLEARLQVVFPARFGVGRVGKLSRP